MGDRLIIPANFVAIGEVAVVNFSVITADIAIVFTTVFTVVFAVVSIVSTVITTVVCVGRSRSRDRGRRHLWKKMCQKNVSLLRKQKDRTAEVVSGS